MSGKEADVYVVRCGQAVRCAKVYKIAAKRSFKQAVLYQEGRKVRNTRRQRALDKRSNYGRKQQEETWQSAETDALSRLASAGVRVPQTYGCIDGVLLMELITDEDGEVAPRLSDVTLSSEQALEYHATLMQYIVRMLCAGLVHGDLSEFNVLLDESGPVIIDLPQAVDAAANNNAQSMFGRDVNNMTSYFAEFAPTLAASRYASEIWSLYESGDLQPDSALTGIHADDVQAPNVDGVMAEIESVLAEEQERQERLREAGLAE